MGQGINLPRRRSWTSCWFDRQGGFYAGGLLAAHQKSHAAKDDPNEGPILSRRFGLLCQEVVWTSACAILRKEIQHLAGHRSDHFGWDGLQTCKLWGVHKSFWVAGCWLLKQWWTCARLIWEDDQVFRMVSSSDLLQPTRSLQTNWWACLASAHVKDMPRWMMFTGKSQNLTRWPWHKGFWTQLFRDKKLPKRNTHYFDFG